jgi:hypothetical protein
MIRKLMRSEDVIQRPANRYESTWLEEPVTQPILHSAGFEDLLVLVKRL